MKKSRNEKTEAEELGFDRPGERMKQKHSKRKHKKPQRLSDWMTAVLSDTNTIAGSSKTYIPSNTCLKRLKRIPIGQSSLPEGVHRQNSMITIPKQKKERRKCPVCRKITPPPILLYKDGTFECLVCCEEYEHREVPCVLSCGHVVCDKCWKRM